MRILSRRFLAGYLASLAACVGACLLALAIVDMLVDFDALVEGGASALIGLVARVPGRWLPEALPFASLAAAFLAAAIPARRGEILALCSAGIHPARAMLPILVAALATGVASSALPAGERERAAGPDAPEAPIGWLRVDDRLVRIGDRDPQSGEPRDLRIFETDPGFRLRRSLRAERARVAGDRWELQGSRELRFDPGAPAAAPRSAAASESLPAPGPPRAHATGGAMRAATAAAVAVLALLAVPIGLGTRASGSVASRALAVLAVAALFRACWQLAAFAADRVEPAAHFAGWLVVALFAAAAPPLWARAPR